MNGRAISLGQWFRVVAAPQTRAAFAGLGHATVILTFVILATALKFTGRVLLTESPAASLVAFASEAVILGAALVLAVPLIVASCNLAPPHGWRRLVWLAVSTPLAIVICATSPLPRWLTGQAMNSVATIQLAVFILLIAVVFEFRHRALMTAGTLMRAEIDAISADASLRDASLKVLQAQVAPHFLFNTLANVRRLSRLDTGAAAAMLGDLVHYFSVTLTHRDAPRCRLGDEARLVDAYLRIHRVRMGTRLHYEVDVPDDLSNQTVPSMMLLTLVENAIKHGINPLVEGGFVSVRAERRDSALRLEVADSGRGLSVSEGHGSGLANIRARLGMLYGPRATLALEQGRPRGLVACISLPLDAEPMA
jgi:hypothetical protein